MVVTQASLLDSDAEPRPRPLGELVERTHLDGGAWVDLRRDWMGRPDVLFERLHRLVPWRAERRRMYDQMVDVPRLVRFYEPNEELPDVALAEARQMLSDHYRDALGEPLCTSGLCLYRDGRDSVAWHGDTIGRGSREDTLVAILSLGEPRRFLLRPRSGGLSRPYELGRGDLLVMGGSCQRTWEHAVPKTRRPAGPRISVQFRPLGVR